MLSIGDLAAQTGVKEGTLRMWEARHGFPSPRHAGTGHRRYEHADVDAVREVMRAREQGLSLPAAIERVRQRPAAEKPSLFAALRERFPELQPRLVPKRVLVPISHAIEDECCQRARRPLLFAAFQRERFYRAAQARWEELGRTAERAIVFADFPRTRRPRHGCAEVALHPTDELRREWVIVCDAAQYAACLVGWERPAAPGAQRAFETIWTVDPAVVRHAARVCAGLARRRAPEAAKGLAERLADSPPPASEELRIAIDLTTRMALYVAGVDR